MFPYKTFLLFLLCLPGAVSVTYAQGKYFTPFKDDSLKKTVFVAAVKDYYKKQSESLSSQNKKEIAEFYKQIEKSVTEDIREKGTMVSGDASAYLQRIVEEIIRVNPELKDLPGRVFFSKAFWPNAYTSMDGTIVFNAALFYRLSNEAQVAYVLCHEISHYYLQHSKNAIERYVTITNSKEYQQQLKEIKKQKYEQNKELDKLEKLELFGSRKHSRTHESESDSMALQFLKKTFFDIREAVPVLALLDTIDKEEFNTEAALKNIFNHPDYPFQERWVKKKQAFFGGTDLREDYKADIDSLKTHPDCKERIRKIEPVIAVISQANAKKNLVDEKKFAELVKIFPFEAIDNCYQEEFISMCLYECLKLLVKFPDDAYLNTMAGKCLNSIYKHQKEHTLNRVVNLPSPYFQRDYNLLLEFIEKLRLDEVGSINYYFLLRNEEKFKGYPAFNETLKEARRNF
ncbi:MAG: M48 family metalloprotease [Ferruginibacter sp.]